MPAVCPFLKLALICLVYTLLPATDPRKDGKAPDSAATAVTKRRAIDLRSDGNKPPISKLPVEILLQIGDFLPPVWQACLALSCRSLYAVYRPSLKDRDLRFPVSFQSPIHPRRRATYFDTQRWLLLELLEDDRWKLCSRCLKLHPVTDFTDTAIECSPTERMCKLGRDGGIVELCPCIKLTHRGILKLIEELLLNPKRPRYVDEIDFSDNSTHLWHSCQIDGGVPTRTRIYPVLEDDGQLRIITVYDLTQARIVPIFTLMGPPILCCPHLDVKTYVGELTQARISPTRPFTVPYEQAARKIDCRWCKTFIKNFIGQWTKTGALIYGAFITMRLLGNSDPAHSGFWFAQTVYSQDPSQDPCGLDTVPFLGLARFRQDLFPRVTYSDLGRRLVGEY